MDINAPILPPEFQTGRAEKNLSRLLHKLNITEHLAADPDFYIKLHNKPYIPLSIERHDEYLHFYHVLSSGGGDSHLDSEIIVSISPDGLLSLYETASFCYQEIRGRDRSFAAMFSRNMLEQGFDKPEKDIDPFSLGESAFNFYFENIWGDADDVKKLGKFGLVKEGLISGKDIPDHLRQTFAELIAQAEAPVPEGIRMVFVHPLRKKANPGTPDEGRMVSTFEIIPDVEGLDRFNVEAPDRETALARALDRIKELLTGRLLVSVEELRQRGFDDELLLIVSNASLQTASISQRFFDSGCRVTEQQEKLARLGILHERSFSLTDFGVTLAQLLNGVETPVVDPERVTSYKVGMKVLIVTGQGQGQSITIDEIRQHPFCGSGQRIHGLNTAGAGFWTIGNHVNFEKPRSRAQILDSFVSELCALDVAKATVSVNEDQEMARQLLKRPVRDMLMQLAISRPSVASNEEYHIIGRTIDEVEDFITEVVIRAESLLRAGDAG